MTTPAATHLFETLLMQPTGTLVSVDDVREQIRELVQERSRLRASVAAIHWNANCSDEDNMVLRAIRDECEDTLPELAVLREEMAR